MPHTLTTCTFCGVGCGIYLETMRNQVVGAYPSVSHPANAGRICVRGWHVHEVAGSPDRLHTPLIRRDGGFKEVGWEEAVRHIADRIRALRDEHGPDSIAFQASPRCSNEESYLLQKLARSVVGTNNVDHGSGVYCNNSSGVLLEMIGTAATTASLADLDQSEVIFVDGVDLARQMPTIGGRVLRAKLRGAKLVVIDGRRHRIAESADIFLQIRPGTEALLYGAMAKLIVDRGLMNQQFIKARCTGYEAFLEAIREYDPLAAADVCGVAPEQIESAALLFARAAGAAVLYPTGFEARSADSIRAIVNLVLLTGQLGKPGAGIFALAEQNNLQGVGDMGMVPNRLPGYRPVGDPAKRAEVERLWGGRIPDGPGLGARDLLTEGGGKVRAVWMCRYDPVGVGYFGDAVEVLRNCELIVAQHLFMTESAKHAHVILPTTAYGEEEVTFTSTERRIQLARKVVEPVEGPTPAWEQIVRVARAMGADWSYPSASDVMDEIARVVPQYSGVSYANLSNGYGRQWPCTTDHPMGTPMLFANGAAEERLRLVAIDLQQGRDDASADYPFTLVFDHSPYYWHRNILVSHSETLRREYRILLLDYPDGFVEINPEDAKKVGIRDGGLVRLSASTGTVEVAARVTSEVRSGLIFAPYFVHQVERQITGGADNGVLSAPVRLEKAS